MFYKHFNMKFILLIMVFIATGVVHILSVQPLLKHEGIYFSNYPFVLCVMLLQPGLTIALVAATYRYWHAKSGNPLSYLRALTDISLVATPIFLYLVSEIILRPNHPSFSGGAFFLFFVTPVEALELFYLFSQLIIGTATYQMTALGNFFARLFVLSTSLAILIFRSRKLPLNLIFPIIISSCLIALFFAWFHPLILEEISQFLFGFG